MSLPIRPSMLPQCTSCLRRIGNLGHTELKTIHQQQIRGKKKMAAAPTTVTVRLLKDVETFGRKGAYVPITIGQMRNEWFPKRVAAYVNDTQLKELKTKNVTAERDFQFGLTDKEIKAAESKAQNSRSKTVEVEKLTPERSIDLLSILLPARLDFYRQPKDTAPPPLHTPTPTPAPRQQQQQQQQQREPKGLSSAAADLLAARSAAPKPVTPVPSSSTSTSTTPNIFGSISTADVASAMKDSLAENHEASRIVIGEQDVRFVNVSVDGQTLPETDRIKQLGEFQVEVTVRGSEKVVGRVVRVLPFDKQGTYTLAADSVAASL